MADHVIAGRYRLENVLGRSPMSEVWSAEDLELRRRVAVKLLAAESTARFEREARAVAALSHPNVTKLFDYGEWEGRPFMVLEHLPGGTLEDRMRAGGPLPDDETHEIATGIAAALAHAHERGVVHRDLKPSNVLFDAEGRPKLADFGIARLAAGGPTLTGAGTVLGTVAYMSPEQAAGAPAGPASDVYSFGVILYRMLTGRLPLEASEPLELLALHRTAEPPPIATYRDGAPPPLEAVAVTALAKDPAERPADGAALLAALEGAPTSEEPTRVMAPPPPARVRRRRALLALAAVPVLALAGALLAYEVTRPNDAAKQERTGPAAATGRPRRSSPPAQSTTHATSAASSTERHTTSTGGATSTAGTTSGTTIPSTPATITVPTTPTTPDVTTTVLTTG